ncbi:hypothetical protein EDC01DRAFT_635847 [Geopyxis carbonaria]|nr:hypothetical protein EDC01DRAFT_635847 [Geopyxis carbonaria]
MADPNFSQNPFGPNFDVYQHVDANELNSALGHFFIQALGQMMDPATGPAGVTPVIPAAAWYAVAHANDVAPSLPQQHPETVADVFPCQWANCGAVFNTPTKLRRHKDKHTARQVQCPLCPAGGRLWERVDHFQTHLLNYHWPFRTEDVAEAVNGLYKSGSGGRVWLNRVGRRLAQEEADSASTEPHTGSSQGEGGITEDETEPTQSERQ